MELLFIFYLGYRNSNKAKRKGLNAILWAVFTIIAYIFAESFGFYLVIFVMCHNMLDWSIFQDTSKGIMATSKLFKTQYDMVINDNPLRGFAIILFGYGGYLLIRYLLDRRPDIKNKGEGEEVLG